MALALSILSTIDDAFGVREVVAMAMSAIFLMSVLLRESCSSKAVRYASTVISASRWCFLCMSIWWRNGESDKNYILVESKNYSKNEN